ncbi:trafficking protein particle complex subunit 13 [Brevipalpus obovatus]|uniref:trafficking protein particle complex subunit 13 n=1 Tax=Brevipalpus obovatus TaxID=246614 RepID=UPI003D9EAFF5
METVRNELVSVKVHRVISKDTKVDHFLSSEEFESMLKFEDDFDQDCIGEDFLDKWQRLPKNLCKAYLGETHYISMMVVNDSVREPMMDVAIQIDMQISNERIISIGQIDSPFLDGKKSLCDILKYEVKDPGNHMVICSISYKDSVGEITAFRRYFKFQVSKPLDVKTKFYNAENDEVFLEAQVENLTHLPICLEKVSLEPSQYFDVTEMNKTLVDDKEQWVFGEINRFNPGESRQYLFGLTPKPKVQSDIKLLASVTNIGKLDIVWITSIGVNGRLQTSVLERMSPGYNGIRLTVEGIPSQVCLEKKFNIVFRLTNYCEYTVEPAVHFDNKSENQPILWLGVSGKTTKKINPFEFQDFQLTAYPVKTGLHPIAKIIVNDVISRTTYEFSELPCVNVRQSEQE